MLDEEVLNELEALRAIYGSDFSDKPPVWGRPCFEVNLRPISYENEDVYIEATGAKYVFYCIAQLSFFILCTFLAMHGAVL